MNVDKLWNFSFSSGEREVESNKNEIERQKRINFCALIVENKDDMSHLAYKEHKPKWEN